MDEPMTGAAERLDRALCSTPCDGPRVMGDGGACATACARGVATKVSGSTPPPCSVVATYGGRGLGGASTARPARETRQRRSLWGDVEWRRVGAPPRKARACRRGRRTRGRCDARRRCSRWWRGHRAPAPRRRTADRPDTAGRDARARPCRRCRRAQPGLLLFGPGASLWKRNLREGRVGRASRAPPLRLSLHCGCAGSAPCESGGSPRARS